MNFIFKRKFLAISIIFLGVISAGYIYQVPQAFTASQPSFVEKAGEGFLAPACGSSSLNVTCSGGSPLVSFSWVDGTSSGECGYVDYITASNGMFDGGDYPCSGSSPSYGGWANNTSYSYQIFMNGGDLGSHQLVSRTFTTPNCNISADIQANGSNSPAPIANNTSATISWSSSGPFNSCTVLPPGWGGLANPGMSTGNLTLDQTYDLSCTGSFPNTMTILSAGISCGSYANDTFESADETANIASQCNGQQNCTYNISGQGVCTGNNFKVKYECSLTGLRTETLTYPAWQTSASGNLSCLSISASAFDSVTVPVAAATPTPPPTYSLTVNSSGSSGVNITSSTGHGGTTNYTLSSLVSGTSVSLTAPSVFGGNNFTSWSGCNSFAGNTCSTTMGSNRTVTANYSAPAANNLPNADAKVGLTSGTATTDTVTVTKGEPVTLFFSAAGSGDADGWNDVQNGGRCDWNNDLWGVWPPSAFLTINNPTNQAACNFSQVYIFNDPIPSGNSVTKTFPIFQITDGKGGRSNVDNINIIIRSACSDARDNNDPEDTLADAQDPACHTDNNPLNSGSYDPTIISETNGTNNNPNVYAGSDKIVNENAQVPFADATATDADGDTLSFIWSCNGGGVSPANGSGGGGFPLNVGGTYTAPSVSANRTFVCTLTVTDGKGGSGVSAVNVLVIDTASTQCNDGVDNADLEDTLADMADPGCLSSSDDDESNSAITQCNDGFDNSDPEDSLVDLADPGCSSPSDNDETNAVITQCNDGVDNADTEDTLVDMADPGCLSPSDTDEGNSICGNGFIEAGEVCDSPLGNGVCPKVCNSSCTAVNACTQCNDGIDNDGDSGKPNGGIDTGVDISCTQSNGTSEFSACNDLLSYPGGAPKDNDGDGKPNIFDPGCHTDGNPNNPASYDPNLNNESNTVFKEVFAPFNNFLAMLFGAF